MKNIRLSLTFLMCLIVNISAYSQDENLSSLDYASELERMVTIPKSPEAAAFVKYGDTDVSLYTGTPNISIPIFSYNGRELSLPVNLTYDASGQKVEDEATWVGAGWNLNVGGRISRITNGLPDDYFSFGINQTVFNATIRQKILKYVQSDRFFDTSLEAHDYFQFISDVNRNAIDIEPDYFSINVLGINDYFVMDLNTMQARSLRNPRIKIEYTYVGYITSFIVTNEDGTKFYFDAVEKTYSVGSDQTSTIGLFQNYISSWLLTKIESSNGKDTYDFIYKDIPIWEQPFPVTPVSHVSHEFDSNSTVSYIGIGADNGPASTFTPSVRLEQKYLTKVRLNGKDIILINFEDRFDTNQQLRNTALKSIQFINNSGAAKTTATFNYGYFGLAQGQNPTTVPYTDIRLKLNELLISGSTAETVQKYKFEYDQPESVSARTSLGQDYLGYQNGKTGNNVLYPTVVSGGITFAGANRDPSLQDAQKGILNKITYPTGGFTLFEYELNTVSTSVTNTVDVQYGSAAINSGTPNMPSGSCGPCCIDKYQTPPKSKDATFEIFESGLYNFSFQSSGTAEVYVFENNSATLLSYNAILGPSCELPLNFSWIKNLNSSQTLTIEESVFLNPGKYQITLINGTFDNSGSSSLWIHRNESQSNVVDMPKAGLRIKNIKDYSSQDQLALTKDYKYIESLLTNKSSGKIIYDPQLYYFTTREYIDMEGAGLETRTTLHRVSKASGGNQPHIGYSRVYEFRKDAAGQSLGNTEHDFNFGQDGIVAQTKPPFSNSFRPDFKIGKEKSVTVHHQNNSTLNSTETTYANDLYYSVLNLSLEQVNNRANQYPNIYYDTSVGKYTYEFLPADWAGFASPTVGTTGIKPTMPSECSEPGNDCIESRFSLFSLYRTIVSGYAGNVSKTTKKDFFGVNVLTTQTEFSYDSNVDYLLRTTNTTDSQGDILVTNRFYTKDFSDDPVYSSMVSRNKLTDVILSNAYKNGNKLFERKNNYNSAGLPELIENAKGAQALEPRILYSYQSNGNLKEAYQVKELIPSGNPNLLYTPTSMVSSFLWGYDSQFPVARVDNATYDQILSSGVILSTVNNPATSDADMRTELQKIRTALPNAQTTTYTYDPLVGVTSITDPRGYTSYFDYDPFNRLHYVKDAESLVQQEIRYHYALPEIVATTTASATAVNSGATVSFTTTASGGSGNFSYKWTVSNANLNQVTTTSTGSFSVATTTSHAPAFTLTCEITDTQTNEKITTSKQVTVNTPPPPPTSISATMAISPSGTTNKSVGQSVRYTMSVSGGSGNYSYKWSKTNGVGQVISFITNSALLFNTVTSDDCTYYQIKCIVTDTTTGATTTKITGINVSSGCGTGGNQQ